MKMVYACFVAVLLAILAKCHCYENSISFYTTTQCNAKAISITRFEEELQNSTEIKFCEKVVLLNKPLIIRNKVDIKLSGDVNITCLQSKSAFIFYSVQRLIVSRVLMENCGNQFNRNASVFVLHCSDVNFGHISVLNSTGIDMYLLNVNNKYEIIDSHFDNGISVSFETRHELTNGSLQIANSTFGGRPEKQKCLPAKCEYGKGLKIIFSTYAIKVKVVIQNCTFRGLNTSFYIQFCNGAMNNNVSVNSAKFEKNMNVSLHILLSGGAMNNKVFVNNTMFNSNTCSRCGGGGLRIDFLHSKQKNASSGNRIVLLNSSFTNNSAKYGGGVFVNSSTLLLNNSITFELCEWSSNSAFYGSALDTTVSEKSLFGERPYYMVPTFINCTFRENYIDPMIKEEMVVLGQGTISANGVVLRFKGNTNFTNNIGTPLYLSSSEAHFGACSNSAFVANKGLNGGAVTLLEKSAIKAEGGASFLFEKNEAFFMGGAMYYKSVNNRDYLTSKHCFLQYVPNLKSSHRLAKPTYVFLDNKAGTYFDKNDSVGQSIYASSFIACEKHCGTYKEPYKANISTLLACTGVFEYNKGVVRDLEVATSEWNVTIERNVNCSDMPFDFIPGKVVKLPGHTTDELGQQLDAVYKVTLWHKNTTETKSRILEAYRYTHKYKVALKGNPSSYILWLVLTREENRKLSLNISIRITQCPPGYTLNEEAVCQCSADLNAEVHYKVIVGCNSTIFQAKLQSGYWVGYINNMSYESLVDSICPEGFCQINSSHDINSLLPATFNSSLLDHQICSNERTGILCANCRSRKSVFFNSNSFQCKANTLCKIGWLFYVLTSMVPITGIFLTVVLFNVKLTSGSIFGFVLYYQMLDTMLISANSIIKFPNGHSILLKFHWLWSRMFNLNFFKIEELSFCLWKGASTLDIIAFEYFTISYALLMVMLTILGMKMCNCTSFCHRVRKMVRVKRQLTNSMIHGISGFFVLCFSEGTRVSLLLLKPIQYEDPYNTLNGTWYVFYDGKVKYLRNKHLHYAIPAFFFIFTISIISPLLLVSYPLCYRVIGESKFSKWICKMIPLEKFKPFFDSFQGSFKDKHRYTSGMYFVYRLIAVGLAVFIPHKIDLFYILFEIQLLVMIFVLAYCQPHKKREHNRQDLFLFSILAVVNALTFYNFKKAVDRVDNQTTIKITTAVQIIVIYIPTVYIAIRAALQLLCRVKRLCAKSNSEVPFDAELLERDSTESNEYSLVCN